MSEIHQIGELLQAGATPSQEEVEQLSELGAFVAAMYGRYLHGTAGTESLTAHTDSFASSIGGRLGATTSTRWERGLGLTEQLLSSEWSGWWQVASRGFASGYGLFDFDPVEVSLYEENPEVDTDFEPEVVRRRRGSLFGKKPAARSARRAPAAVRRAALAGAPSSRRVAAQGAGQARWIDGGFAELATLDALESGGLFLGDQIDSNAAGRPAAQRRPALLDGLFVDDRTPALSSALSWAEAVYGQRADGAGLSVNTERVESMTSVASSSSLDRGRGALQRPVFAFFDSVQGDFLSLEPETTSAPAVKAAPTVARTRRPSLFATTSAPDSRAPRPAVDRRRQRRSDAPVVTSIDRLVRASGPTKTAVRPYTEGVFPTVAPRAIRTAPTMVAARPAPMTRAAGAASASTTSAPAASAPAAGPRVSARPATTLAGLSAPAAGPRVSARPATTLAGLAAPPLQLATHVTYTLGGTPQTRIQRASSGAPRASVATASPTGIARALQRVSAPAAAGRDAGSSELTTLARALAMVAAPAAEVFVAETPAAGMPAAGMPAAGMPAAGMPAAGMPAADMIGARPTLTISAPETQWRLAADLGPDMPLGATLGKSEIFGAAASAYAAPQTLVERTAFAPTVARGGKVAQGFGSRAFTAAIDGVVWVAPEQGDTASIEETPVEAALSRMPLATVPRGRAATMVPASVAMELGALAARRPNRLARQAQLTDLPQVVTATAAPGMPEAAPGMPEAAPRPTAFDLETRNSREEIGALAARQPNRLARQAQLTDLQQVVTATAAPGMPGAAPRPTAFDLETRISRALQSGMVAPAPVAATSTPAAFAMMASAPAAFEALVTGLTDEGAAQWTAPIAQPRALAALPRSAEVSRGLISRWADQLSEVGRGAGATTSSAPARFAAGAYARFDTPRDLVSIFDAAAPEADAAEPTVAFRAPRSSGRQAGALRRVATPTLGSIPAITTALPVMGTSRTAQAVSGATVARNALRRPVATARETRSVAPLVSVLRQATAFARATATQVEVEPVLSRRIQQVTEARANALVGGPTEAPVTTILEQLSGLGASETRAVMQTLRSAGWTAPEIEMLTLSDEGAIDATSADSAPVTHREAVTQLHAVRRAIETARAASAIAGGQRAPTVAGEAASFAAAVVAPELTRATTMTPQLISAAALPPTTTTTTTPAAEVATAARMGRNLARAVSGTEALGAPVAAGQLSPEALSSVASAQAASFMPILAGASPDSYFGATAPERATHRGAHISGLRDAVGELVAMAQELASVADTAVEEGAGQRVLNRLVGSRTRLQSRRPPVRASVARVLAAGSNERELVAALARVPVAERHEALALARANAPQVVERIEQAVASGAVGFESGLADLIAGRTLPTVGIDAATADAAPATAPRTRRFGLGGALEATYVEPGHEPSEGVDREMGGLGESGIGGRVTSALRASTRGPAGARRLLQPLAQAHQPRHARMMRAAERKARSLTEASAPTDLASVLAPEAMLGGLRSHELNEAMAGIDVAKAQAFRGEAPGVFATFADSGVDMASPTATVLGDPAVSRRASARRGVETRAQRSMTRRIGTETAPTRVGAEPVAVAPKRSRSLFKSDPVQVLLQLVGRDPAAAQRAFAGGEAGMTRRSRAGLFSAIMRGADRREAASLFQQAGASDFAFSWLARVDGTRSGLDIGLGGARAEMGRAFGSRTTSARMASESPIHQASFVGPAAGPSRTDRSGLRSLAAHARPGRGGRPSHGASAALRRTDWRFVETGSRAQAAHADLGKLASAIVSSSQAASRAPLPLIAPAAKAVAQTALRSANTEARPGQQQSKASAKKGADRGNSKQPQAALSEEALEQLAIEMASRVAQIMGRNKERIGVWH